MTIKQAVKGKLKTLIKVYTQLQADSKKIQFKQELGDNLVFATGFDKSGTTWLMDILDGHPEITCRGSGQIFNYYVKDQHFLGSRGGYGELVNNIVDSRWFENGGKVWFTKELVLENARNFIGASFSRYNAKNSRFIGDKSTVQDVGLIRKIFPNTKIICMVRDGRDVAVSFAFHFKRGGKTDKFNSDGTFRKDYLVDVARAWSFYSSHIRKNIHDQKLMIVKYEDLLENTEKVIGDIYTFMAVHQDKKILGTVKSNTSFQNLSGGRAPGQEDASSYFRKGIVGDWKNHFGEEEKKILKDISGEELINWGYENNSDW